MYIAKERRHEYKGFPGKWLFAAEQLDIRTDHYRAKGIYSEGRGYPCSPRASHVVAQRFCRRYAALAVISMTQ